MIYCQTGSLREEIGRALDERLLLLRELRQDVASDVLE